MAQEINIQLDVEELLELFEEKCTDVCEHDEYTATFGYSTDRVVEIIQEYAQKKKDEVSNLKWKEIPYAEECGDRLVSNFECPHCHTWKSDYTYYCPDCGKYVGIEVDFAKRDR